jgi:hypothetical protein
MRTDLTTRAIKAASSPLIPRRRWTSRFREERRYNRRQGRRRNQPSARPLTNWTTAFNSRDIGRVCDCLRPVFARPDSDPPGTARAQLRGDVRIIVAFAERPVSRSSPPTSNAIGACKPPERFWKSPAKFMTAAQAPRLTGDVQSAATPAFDIPSGASRRSARQKAAPRTGLETFWHDRGSLSYIRIRMAMLIA